MRCLCDGHSGCDLAFVGRDQNAQPDQANGVGRQKETRAALQPIPGSVTKQHHPVKRAPLPWLHSTTPPAFSQEASGIRHTGNVFQGHGAFFVGLHVAQGHASGGQLVGAKHGHETGT